jgi:hypothetical protein
MRYLNDLILTDTFLLRGNIDTGGQRLTSFLNNVPKRFFELHEVAATNHVTDEQFTATRMFVRIDEVLIAHEIGEGGDDRLRLLAAEERVEIPVTAQFGGTLRLQLLGKVHKHGIERETSGPHDFIVVVEPKIQGLRGTAASEYAGFKHLPYVIANRNRLTFIYAQSY